LALLAGCGARPAASVPDLTATPTTRTTPPKLGCTGGVRFSLTGGDAAMGIRVVTIEMVNCGSRAFTVNGYPGVRLFDEEHNPIQVDVGQGSASVASVPEFDNPPAEVILQPGEKARSGLLWRNLVIDGRGAAMTAFFLEATPADGQAWQEVTVRDGASGAHIDIGTTGRVAVQAWQKA
jgi:hypothetical protein